MIKTNTMIVFLTTATLFTTPSIGGDEFFLENIPTLEQPSTASKLDAETLSTFSSSEDNADPVIEYTGRDSEETRNDLINNEILKGNRIIIEPLN